MAFTFRADLGGLEPLVVLTTRQPLLSFWWAWHIFRAGKRIAKPHGVAEKDSVSSGFQFQPSI